MARTYQVEMIVFSNEGTNSAEATPANAEQQSREISALIANARHNGQPGLGVLGGIRNTLATSSQHRILQSMSWTQRQAGYASSPLVAVSSSGNGLDGVVRVYAPNLLFAELNLRFRGQGLTFLREQRRLKLKEIHYFDHPHFGVILTVRPI